MGSPAVTTDTTSLPRLSSRQRVILLVLLGAGFMLSVDFSILNVALPKVAAGVGLGFTELPWITAATALPAAGFTLLFGRMADLFGRRRVFVSGVALLAGASLLGGFASNPEMLLTARVLQGFATAMATPAALSLLTTSFPEGAMRDRVLGLNGALLAGGFIAGSLVGGGLVGLLSWRAAFFINAPVALAILLLTPSLISESSLPERAKLDLPGAVTVTGGLLAVIYAIIDKNIPVAVVGVLLLAAFWLIEMRSSMPLAPVRILARPSVKWGNYAGLVVFSMETGMIFLMTLYLQQVLDLSPLITGLVFGVPGLAAVGGGLVAGQRRLRGRDCRLRHRAGQVAALHRSGADRGGDRAGARSWRIRAAGPARGAGRLALDCLHIGWRRDRALAAEAMSHDAYGEQLEPHRRELLAHCYRMLGSLQDAEDAVQETLLKAWRGLERFEGRSSVRTWLYTIATNVCLRMIEQRRSRVLPIDYGPPSEPHAPLGPPLLESTWIEPYPDAQLALADELSGPEARYEQREAVELAFIAALQHLPARQRAVLILRDVLGFSGAEVAAALDATPASVYSLLQRAHATLDDRLPDRSQQATLRSLGDERLSAIVDRYVEAWARNDVDALVEMLTESATLAMPPIATWYRGRDAIGAALRSPGRLDGGQNWRLLPTSANGQVAMGAYLLDSSGTYVLHYVTVLTLRQDKIDEITDFPDASAEQFGLPARA